MSTVNPDSHIPAGSEPSEIFQKLPLQLIDPDPNNPRTALDEGIIADMAETIAAQGDVINPLLVRHHPDMPGRYMIIFGATRRIAALQAIPAITQVSCLILQREPTDAEILEQRLIEDGQRSALGPIELARAFARYMTLNSLTTASQVAERLKFKRARGSGAKHIRDTLSLLTLTAEVQEQISDGRLPAASAYHITALEDPALQRTAASQAIERKSNANQVAAYVRRLTQGPPARRGGTRHGFRLGNEKKYRGTKLVLNSNRVLDLSDIFDVLVLALMETKEDVRASTDNVDRRRPLNVLTLIRLLEQLSKDASLSLMENMDEVMARIGPALVLELLTLTSHADRSVRNEFGLRCNRIDPDLRQVLDLLSTRRRKPKAALEGEGKAEQ
jgi:ParB/RepB/Spo0J family partition protein